MIFCWVLFLFSASIINVQASCNINTVYSSWGKNSNGKFEFTVPASTTTGLCAKFFRIKHTYIIIILLGWTIEVTFDKPVKKLKVWNGKKISCSGTVCTFNNKNWNKVQNQGSILSLGYQVKFEKKPVGNLVSLKFNGIDVCSSTDTTTTAATTTITTTTTTTTTTATTTTAATTTEESTTTPTSTTTTSSTGSDDSCSDVVAYNSIWDKGASGKLEVEFPNKVSSWTIEITFTAPVTDFQVWVGDNIECTGNTCKFDNMPWNGNMEAGSVLGIDFLYYFDSTSGISGVSISGQDICTGSGGDDTTTTEAPVTTTANPGTTTANPGTTTANPGTTTENPGTTTANPGTTTANPGTTTANPGTTSPSDGSCINDDYGFADALDKSLLFYEAQRSGDLPEDEMRITWRKDSALNDKGNNNEDLTGGYYDGE